jgi:hypothetical protein
MVENGIGGGYYQCYCKRFKKFTMDTKNLCFMMTYDKNFARILNMCVTFGVVIVGSINKILVRNLVGLIGYDTDSERVSIIMVATFVANFISLAFIPLFTNANLAYTPIFRYIPMRMNYSDFE